MNKPRPHFSFYVHCYVWLFFVIFCGFPFVVLGSKTAEFLPESYWWAAAFWPVGIFICGYYANHRCTSEALTYKEALLYVAACSMTGWSYFTLVFLFPLLLAFFILSLLAAIYGDFRDNHGYAQQRLQRLVQFFYRHRMHQ